MTVTSTLEGRVELTNERGLKLNGQWLNVSKFRPLDVPTVGSIVRVAVDAKGFLSSVQVLEPSQTQTPTVVSRDVTITRLAVLKAAAMFGASRGDLKSSDVLRIADAWLAWVEHADE